MDILLNSFQGIMVRTHNIYKHKHKKALNMNGFTLHFTVSSLTGLHKLAYNMVCILYIRYNKFILSDYINCANV